MSNQNNNEKSSSKEKLDLNPRHGQALVPPTGSTASRGSILIRFVQWLLGYAIPLYIIVGALCYIAAPDFFSSILGQPTATQDKRAIANGVVSAHVGASAAVPPSASTGELKTMEIVRVAMDASKERIESIKEGNDKLFSIISALAALLVFLGFKGVETFRSLNTQAEETLRNSKIASETASQTTIELKDFFENKYPKDNTAEINVAQALVLREMADLYRGVVCRDGPLSDQCQDTYDNYLDDAIMYLNRVCNHAVGLEKKTVSRALIIRGNVLKMRGRTKDALASVLDAHENYDETDSSALYNAACYSSLLAKEAIDSSRNTAATKHISECIGYLRKAIKMKDDYVRTAMTDSDFDHLRNSKSPQFLSIFDSTNTDR